MPVDLKWEPINEVEIHRLYENNPHLRASSDHYCPTCLTKGSFQWKGETVICDCQEQLQLHKHYLVSGIGDTYQRLTWEDYTGDPKAKELCDEYLKNHEMYVARGIGIMLSGMYGVGKTMALSLLLKDLMKLGYKVYSTTFAAMVDSFTAGWNSEQDKKHFNLKMRSSQILLLDDLGKEFKTKNALAETTFDSVLRFRVQNSKPTFLTTNMSRTEMRTGYGSAILSLLTESSMDYEFDDDMDSRRKVKHKKLEEIRNGQTRPIH